VFSLMWTVAAIAAIAPAAIRRTDWTQ